MTNNSSAAVACAASSVIGDACELLGCEFQFLADGVVCPTSYPGNYPGNTQGGVVCPTHPCSWMLLVRFDACTAPLWCTSHARDLLPQFMRFIHFREELRSHILMMCRRVVLCPIIGEVLSSWSPEKTELVLCFLAAQPIESHIHRLGTFWLDLVIYYAFRGRVVCLYRRAWLRVSHFV